MREPRHILMALALPFLAAMSAGCGNMNHVAAQVASKSSYQLTGDFSDPSSNGGLASDTGYSCPSSPKILPTSPAGGSSDDAYTVCVSQANAYDLSIHGEPYVDTWATGGKIPKLCVYPREYVSDTQYRPLFDSSGLPIVACVDYSEDAMRVTFPGVSYNGIAIVLESSSDQMNRCIAQGKPTLCPRHSRGKFR